MRPWQFSKPKDPGFGISRSFYLSVLASKAVLPSVRELANPGGADGALPGFAVPLGGTNDKSLLDEPIRRGNYAVASKDRKTILRLTVISRDEAGFDPEAFALSELAIGKSPELLARIRGTWTVCQLSFESHDAMVYPSLDFVLAAAVRLGNLSEGVIGDGICRRYLLPDQVFSRRRANSSIPIFVEEHVVIHGRMESAGLHVFTLGMQKFALPEIEVLTLQSDDLEPASTCLLWLAQQILQGVPVKESYQVGSAQTPLEVREGGFDRGLWEGIPAWELLPPTGVEATDAIRDWQREILADS